ncbi:MAG: transcriptional regulator [Planctomycetota bacterium]
MVRYRFDDFAFDPTTGEITRGSEHVARLAPQPARLLELLVERRGELLGRDEIRAALWSDVQVEFDQSLHFCVRQARQALGDSGREPRYVLTLPRRGYRFGAEVVIEDEREGVRDPAPPSAHEVDASRETAPPASSRRSARRLVLVAVPLLVAVLAAAAYLVGREDDVVLAILPFEVPQAFAATFAPGVADVPTLLVDRLVREERLAVVGPTTTEGLAVGPAPIAAVAAATGAAFVVNARFVRDPESGGLLAEVVRSTDGVHVWTQLFGRDARPEEIADAVAAGLRSELLHGDRR